jgi:tetratricopeptide (TPR) repeat protein
MRGPIGQGGMATVYEVVDQHSGRRLALKRLHRLEDPRRQRRGLQLFEREFHTLAHLAHPRVVEVYDYGVDELGPYYTMELLDGGDLHRLAPAPWRQACALARDVASALSLLHSRRMVYRDLSPRNVRCTSDGHAKLIDFGAMVAMGPSKQIVGTPAYCPPEALNLEALDARTDLYALGATLYYTLVGRHAFPARDFKQLREIWRARVVPPSSIVGEIPPALDRLVLDLLQLDPAARPASAAEVIERLAALEGRELDEQLLVSRSYLRTPNLVGRDAVLARARAKTLRAMRGRGGALLISGGPGVGRSRFLDACVIEAKLQGALVLLADARDGRSSYGAVRALGAQLLALSPEVALPAARKKLALLAHAVPELLSLEPGAELRVFESQDQLRTELQPALREWLLAVSTQRPLVLVVDDLNAIDEPSAAFFALLSRDVKRRAMLLVASVDVGAEASSASAPQLYAEVASKLELTALSSAQSEQLLRSVFGDVPHVGELAQRLYGLSSGNPRDLMQLAQHLLDKGAVRYQAGAFTLPASIDAIELPSSMAQALRLQIEALSTSARELAQALALCPERSMSFDECSALCACEPAQTVPALDALLAAQIVAGTDDNYAIARRDWVHALQSFGDEDSVRRLHRRVSDMFARRGDDGFRVARHLFLAGDNQRGLEALIEHAEQSQVITDSNADAFYRLVFSMPSDGFDYYELGMRLCVELNRPRRELYALQNRLSGMIALLGIVEHTHLRQLLAQLTLESGLCDYAELDASLEGMPRLIKALELAQARYQQAGEHERVLDPLSAIRQLARATITAAGVISTGLDHELWLRLPSLAPLEPLSPAISAVNMLMQGLGARITARMGAVRAVYERLLERVAQPDHAGLDPAHHDAVAFGVNCGLGMVEASLGLVSCLERARVIEAAPLHRVNALLIRMLHHLMRGENREADDCKRRADLLRIQDSPRQFFEGTQLLPQIAINAAADDLTRIKRTIEEIDPLARRYPNWVPVLRYGMGEYHRVRGDHAASLQALESALCSMKAGCHQLWPNAAGALLRALYELGRYDEARERGDTLLAEAELAGGLGSSLIYLRQPLALVDAKLGRRDPAESAADAVIAELRRLGSEGLILAAAYEVRARVAIVFRDEPAFERNAALCAQQLRLGASRVLSAKYERLKQDAQRAELRLALELPELQGRTETLSVSYLTSLLDVCRTADDRDQQVLAVVLQHCGANEGFLYRLGEDGVELSAKMGERSPASELVETVRDYLEEETRADDMCTASLDPGSPQSLAPAPNAAGSGSTRMLLLSHATPEGHVVTGVVVALMQRDQRFLHPGAIIAQLSRLLHEP